MSITVIKNMGWTRTLLKGFQLYCTKENTSTSYICINDVTTIVLGRKLPLKPAFIIKLPTQLVSIDDNKFWTVLSFV